MLTITKSSYTFYSELPKNQIIHYPDLLSPDILKLIRLHSRDKKALLTCIGYGIGVLTQAKYTPVPTKHGGILVIVTSQAIVEDTQVDFGHVLLVSGLFREEHAYRFPENWFVLYEDVPTQYLFLRTQSRYECFLLLKTELSKYHQLKPWEQCINKLLTPQKQLGYGCYGSVSKHTLTIPFAMKLSKLKDEVLTQPIYNKESTYWNELHILRMVSHLVLNKICPNFPILYDVFTCKKCDIQLKKGKVTSPCMITMMELADGNLREFLTDKTYPEELLSNILFQIMVAIHTIQYHYQINHYDIKCDNILYFKVEKGGYWKYRIHGIDFYLPNLGYIFVLSDFGTSKTFNPVYPVYSTTSYFRLGHRYAILVNKKFVPIQYGGTVNSEGNVEPPLKIKWTNGVVSQGGMSCRNKNGEFLSDMILDESTIDLLKQNKLFPLSRELFQKPEVIPPFEFYNDTQDGIRMFCGGKRTTQSGTHRRFDIPSGFKKRLEKYKGRGESMKDGRFSIKPEQVLAGYFIEEFFKEYKQKPEGKVLESYTIS